ncbi:MAG: hypothetical protein ABS938_07565 [Psychrobacillus psychrodurans]
MKKLTFIAFIITISLSVLMGNSVNSKATDSDNEYIYPSNKERVFSETVDEFYIAIRELNYPVHQEYYQKYMPIAKARAKASAFGY